MVLTVGRPTLFCDLDNTLYSASLGINSLMSARIEDFCISKLGMKLEEVERIRSEYLLKYGLTIRGLLLHHHVDPTEFDNYVDGGLELDQLLAPSQSLRQMLVTCKADLWLFTNAGIKHARRCLALLGLEDVFPVSRIIFCNYAETNFPCKPETRAFHRAMNIAGVTDPSMCYFVDDSFANITKAEEIGWTSVHVAPRDLHSDCGQICIESIHDLHNALPFLWRC